MTDELTYRIAQLRLFDAIFKRIYGDPQTTKATHELLNEAFDHGSNLFPVLVSGEPKSMARQTAFLRQCAEICNEILGDIWRDPEAPYSTRAIISHALTRLGYLAWQHQKERSPYDLAHDEVCPSRNIPPPRRPPLQVYEPGNDCPREVMVFRR